MCCHRKLHCSSILRFVFIPTVQKKNFQNLLTYLVSNNIIDPLSQSTHIYLTSPDKRSDPMIAEDHQKFLSLEEDKRERILNAAMQEFLNGYKKASTDNIVREAGISKGLLFHYFGTKENLYNFLVDYAIDTVQREYIDLINVHQRDILDSIWQLSLLKQDLSRRFPTIFEFLICVYVDDKDCPAKAHLKRFHTIQAKMIQDVYSYCDKSLFRDDIPPEKIIGIIVMVLEGYSQQKVKQLNQGTGESVTDSYETYLAEIKEYLDILRKVFYKQN